MRRALRTFAMTCLLLGGALWAAIQPRSATAPVHPRRVVSLNLCADQIVLAVADRGQIAGLSRNAADAEMSAAAEQARGLRILGSSAEQVLEIDPDLVAGMPAGGGGVLASLRRRGYPTLDVGMANGFADIETSIRATGIALGHEQRAEAILTSLRRELATIPKNGRGRVAAYYQRRGFMTGTGTLVDELMARVGLVNLAAKLHKSPLSQVSLEEMVAARPDFLIVESATDTVVDQGTEMLHHPALDGIPRITLPEAWTVCGGPAYVQAARTISAQIAAQDQRRRR